jgi:hypothetical protein
LISSLGHFHTSTWPNPDLIATPFTNLFTSLSRSSSQTKGNFLAKPHLSRLASSLLQ